MFTVASVPLGTLGEEGGNALLPQLHDEPAPGEEREEFPAATIP